MDCCDMLLQLFISCVKNTVGELRKWGQKQLQGFSSVRGSLAGQSQKGGQGATDYTSAIKINNFEPEEAL